ncbi:hypothetical protein [Mesorhizobium kowhaii]|uniref:Uncharacterized protein n=1 Tax=Mesorhizobium kowhaii TaxID=1300272 RepID=A0A2W7C2H7_9HYPH|nr:hypothetical protein [Mesorhizobium kowhaii]PZV37147.1 hypothetical protein B5V02_18290 [Mesorhizobium kowhaii]
MNFQNEILSNQLADGAGGQLLDKVALITKPRAGSARDSAVRPQGSKSSPRILITAKSNNGVRDRSIDKKWLPA